MSKILITGATGNLGSDTIDFLLTKTNSASIAALVRDKDTNKVAALKEKGIEIRVGNYDDSASLVSAFSGIDQLYFISGNNLETREKQHENVVNAAKEAGVKRVIYTSFMRKNETETSPIAFVAASHIKTENMLKASGLSYTILKHNIYMDMLPLFLGDQLAKTGIAYFPAGEGKIAFTLRKDMAEVASVILTTSGHVNKTYEITNDVAVSMQEVITEISSILGRSIRYVSPTQEEYIATLSEAGVPMEYIGMFAGFAEAFKQEEFSDTNNLIESFIGRKPEGISSFLTNVYSKN